MKQKEVLSDRELLEKIREDNKKASKWLAVLSLGVLFRRCFFVVLLVVGGLIIFSPEVLLSNPVGYASGVIDLNSSSLVGVLGSNISEICLNDFDCVVRKSLLVSSELVPYKFDSFVGELKNVNLALIEGSDCEEKAFVFCSLVMQSNFRCSVVGVSERKHAFARVWNNQDEVFCFDPTVGLQVDCSVLESGLVVFDSVVVEERK